MARKTRTQKKKKEDNRKETGLWIAIVIIGALGVMSLLRYGAAGLFLYRLQRYVFGNLFLLILILLCVMIAMALYNHRNGTRDKHPLPFLLIIMAVLLTCSYLDTSAEVTGMDVLADYLNATKSFFSDTPLMEAGGGVIGALLYAVFSLLFGRPGVIVVIAVLCIIALLLMTSLDIYKDAFYAVREFFRLPEKEEPEPEPEEEPKPSPNLWNLLEEKKEKHEEQRRLKAIQADEKEEESDELRMINDPEKPHLSHILNIRADAPTEEIPVVKIPGKVVSDQKNIFINVDDLSDERRQPAGAPTTYTAPVQQTPVTKPVVNEAVQQPVQNVKPAETAGLPEMSTVGPNSYQTPVVKKNKVYHLPKINLLDPLPSRTSNAENEAAAKEKSQALIQILKNFDIDAELLDVHIGPAVTQFEIRPDPNVKVSRINGLVDNIKMQLAAKDVRIEAPIPGRNAVGVEIPNVKSTAVKMREIFNDVPAKEKDQPLLFYLGKDLLGRTVTCRLDKMPHLLIAGATGSGKSVCMNAIITSLLMRTNPDEVKMLLVDPKKVEFTPYHHIPHLIGPVINDANQASNALKVIVRIMDERYNIFAACGARNIQVYNEMVKKQGGRPNPDGSPAPKAMPYIVVIIDELADLMNVAGKEVESSIQRITQLARASGIHLIVATQRPSVDVITGVIKSNIPSRIAFAVSSGTDSRTILDHVGAERLLGYGDMLYMPMGESAASRVQGVYVTDEEVQRITEYVSSQATPVYDDSFVMLEGVDGNGELSMTGVNDDPLYQEVRSYVIEAQKASTSLLQRRFGIGYNRAARMIDQLEQEGVIGPVQGSKPREVRIKPEGASHRTETGGIAE